MAAIWTTTDRDNVKAAILALATGSRTASVSLGDKSIQYTNADIAKLEALLSWIVADIEMGSTAGGFANKVKFGNPL